MYPSCHDAPVIVTDQIQCTGVCVHGFTVCVSFRVCLRDENSDLRSSGVISVCVTREFECLTWGTSFFI